MQPSRRDFVRLGLGSTALLACGTSVPTFLARSASALAVGPNKAPDGRILVVLFLGGGNDGLNTVVPYRDPDYRKARPKLHLADAPVHKIDDRLAFHPSLKGFAQLLERRQLAIVQGVGYPNPNRSHFHSMSVLHTARLHYRDNTPGWLARWLDARPRPKGADAPALHISPYPIPQALTGGKAQVPTLNSLEDFLRRVGVPEAGAAKVQRARLDRIGGAGEGPDDSLLQFVQRSTVVSYTSSAQLEGVLKGKGARTGYPMGFGLARRLSLIAQLIKAGLKTSLYYTWLDGFDTHANQLPDHASLLQEVGDSFQAFFDNLTKAGEARRVLVVVCSEFGRRVAGGDGTDHGTAGPVFLLGGAVKAGVHGPYPDLQKLEGGDLKTEIDFRRVYATILDQWFGSASEAILGGRFDPLPVLEGS
jgi:uncharacterized protein (DUF1501 family)